MHPASCRLSARHDLGVLSLPNCSNLVAGRTRAGADVGATSRGSRPVDVLIHQTNDSLCLPTADRCTCFTLLTVLRPPRAAGARPHATPKDSPPSLDVTTDRTSFTTKCLCDQLTNSKLQGKRRVRTERVAVAIAKSVAVRHNLAEFVAPWGARGGARSLTSSDTIRVGNKRSLYPTVYVHI
ncbi:hypothetical protein EVAR_51650_1 [Eumeta japonica]|uniref:Uncharacterized protein n=1 Tax=Eumeta variegata TaxID=151549 RepID=A0A4C1YCZ1_EUMVA|nr:hypothetical protein EVAR_51650_1 [Eumeta japonica]